MMGNVVKNWFSNLKPRTAICIQGSVLREKGPSLPGNEEKYQFKDDDCIQTTDHSEMVLRQLPICSDTSSDSS